MTPRVVTIGAYGYSAEGFFGALRQAEVDVFLDVRQRRGVRGARYSFVNSGALVPALETLGIEYRHLKALAPDTDIRALQQQADSHQGTTKYQRKRLSPAFVDAYEARRSSGFDWQGLASSLSGRCAIAVFCVEERPEQCHRSLVAQHLAHALQTEVIDLRP